MKRNGLSYYLRGALLGVLLCVSVGVVCTCGGCSASRHTATQTKENSREHTEVSGAYLSGRVEGLRDSESSDLYLRGDGFRRTAEEARRATTEIAWLLLADSAGKVAGGFYREDKTVTESSEQKGSSASEKREEKTSSDIVAAHCEAASSVQESESVVDSSSSVADEREQDSGGSGIFGRVAGCLVIFAVTYYVGKIIFRYGSWQRKE